MLNPIEGEIFCIDKPLRMTSFAAVKKVRAVLRNYVMQIDSLNRQNERLQAENTQVKEQLAERNSQIAGLSNEKASLSQKVAIAAQLDATNIQLLALKKAKR